MPIKQELKPEQMVNVFGYPRDLRRRYEITKVLGAGSFGIVREAVCRETGRQYACKTVPKMPKRGKPTPRYLLKLQQEVDAMQQLGGSFDAVYLRDVFEDDSNIHMVMELCTGGSILEQLKNGQPQSEADVADIIRCILRFIAQCHTKGIIYRDVKPDNFLYLTPEASSVKATDFGLSIRHWPGEPKLRSRSGTPVYMAPEVVLQEYDEQADVWSVGILLYQLLTGRFPFWEDIRNLSLQQVWQAILSQRIDMGAPELRKVSPAAKDLLTGLLERDPDSRLTPKQALDHPWVREPGVASLLPLDGSVVQRLQRFGTYSHLKQIVLRIITHEISGKDAERKTSLDQLREIFERMDADSSGALSAEELSKGLSSLGYQVSPREFEKLVERIDLNADGAINFDEFAASLVDWQQLQNDNMWAKWIDVAFSKLDVNGDGFISVDEIVRHMPESQDESERMVAVSKAKRTMREADTNGDGLVSKEEFVHLLLGTPVSDSLDAYDARIARQ
jgi:calcium-dependent protein kinase